MGFVQQEKIRVPWCFVSNTRSPGREPPLEWKNLAHVPCSQFHSTSGKSSVPKSSSCKKDFLHLHCANEKTPFYEVLNIYLKYKRPADGWPHHPWHPLRFTPSSRFGEDNSVAYTALSLCVFTSPMRVTNCSKHQAADTSSNVCTLLGHTTCDNTKCCDDDRKLKPCREAMLPHPNWSNPEAARLSAAGGHHHSSLKDSRGKGIMLGWCAALNEWSKQKCREPLQPEAAAAEQQPPCLFPVSKQGDSS